MVQDDKNAPASEERGIPQVGRVSQGNRWGLLLGIAVIVVLALALGAQSLINAVGGRHKSTDRQLETIKPVLPNLTDSAFRHVSVQPAPAPAIQNAQPPPPLPKAEPSAEERAALQLADRRRKSSVIVSVSSNPRDSSAGLPALGSASTSAEYAGQKASSLSDALVATRAASTNASLLRDPNMMVTQGMFLDCVLQTAINSSLPGMTSCELTRNVFSTNGRVLLLERGSRLVGQYQSNQLKQGQKRIFVLWTRAETPNGVIINLDSPSTDTLGRSGADGDVDIHFWERFGAALLISLVDDVGQYAANKNSRGDSTSISYGNTINSTQNAASIVVKNTINIPPTLDKAQGSHINIFVARDLYFGNVYELVAANPE
jgi:type IV secretion system protein VirB10